VLAWTWRPPSRLYELYQQLGDLGSPLFLACSQLKDLKTELSALRVDKVTGGAPNKLSKM